MKPRNREVNIFNMSLLDILCGALGAFCFMMLVLFPYWRPGGANAKEVEQNSEAMQQQLADLRRQVEQMPNGEALMQKFTELQQRLQQSTGELNRALQDLEAERKRAKELETRNPIVIAAEWYTAKHDVDIYVQWDNIKQPEPAAPPDVNKNQSAFWRGETRTSCRSGPCQELWMIRDIIPDVHLKIHYKFMAANGNPEPASIAGYYLFDGDFYRLPAVTISADKHSAYVGYLSVKPNYKLDFTPAPEFAESYRQILERDKKRSD